MCYDKLCDEITLTPSWAYAWGPSSGSSVPERIAAFLDGKTCGEDLLHELYDHVLQEPIPEAMRAILNNT
jgi:hypothetical protein